jgi:hypothetical protein
LSGLESALRILGVTRTDPDRNTEIVILLRADKGIGTAPFGRIVGALAAGKDKSADSYNQ